MKLRRCYRIQEFRDAIGKWKWQVISGNGDVVATCGPKSYTRRFDLRRVTERLFHRGVKIVVEKP